MKRRGFIASLIGAPVAAKALPTVGEKIDKNSIIIDLCEDKTLYGITSGRYIEYCVAHDIKQGEHIRDAYANIFAIALQNGKKGQIIKAFMPEPLEYSKNIKKYLRKNPLLK